MDKELKARLDKAADLSNEELQTLVTDLLTSMDEYSKGSLSDDDLAAMDTIATKVMEVKEILGDREKDASARQSRADEIKAKVAPAEGEKTEEKADEIAKVEAQAEEAVEKVAEAEEKKEESEAEGEKVAVAASTKEPTVGEIASRRPEEMAPRMVKNNGLAVTAAADVPGFSAGSEIPDWESVGSAFADKVESLMGGRGLGRRYPVARFNVDYPDDRKLSPGDPSTNSRRVREVIAPQAIVAAGGLCAPVEASYSLANISAASRPLRDALPKFNAKRGGIRFITPPHLTDAAGAVGVISMDDDAMGYPPANKPILTVTCGEEVVVQIEAISVRLKIGNFSRMTFPEQFPVWYDLALAQHARTAEGRILTHMSTASTQITDGQNLGVSRDLLEAYDRYATQYRNRHRMPIDATLQAFLPYTVVAMVRSDVLRQMPGDGLDTFNVTRQTLEGWFRARNISVTWYLDERSGAGQIYPAQGSGAGLGWKSVIEGYLFHPGAFLFLDGGSLDFGIEIRDSVLNSTNDVESFLETFEGVAFTGIESLRIRNTVCVSGQASGVVDLACASLTS